MTIAGIEQIDLSDTEFWGWPLRERAAAFALLRAQDHPVFYAEPEVPFAEQGPGYYALVRHADVVEASRNPEDALQDVEPVDDAVASAAYRKAVLVKLVREALDRLESR